MQARIAAYSCIIQRKYTFNIDSKDTNISPNGNNVVAHELERLLCLCVLKPGYIVHSGWKDREGVR